MGNQTVRNTTITTGATSVTILPLVPRGMKRTSFIVTNISALAVVTIAMGNNAAVADQGIRLTPNSAYIQSTDSGFTCFQDQIQCISDVAGSIALVETLEDV
jgi:hypothetical protein